MKRKNQEFHSYLPFSQHLDKDEQGELKWDQLSAG
jgi:hypothetical protein